MVPEKLAELPLSPSESFDREFWESFHALSYSEIGRIRTLISELVNLARPATPDFSEEDLSAVIGPMLELTRKEAAKKGIFIESRVESELPPVWIDPSRIKQVLLNLILNALYAAPEGGRVEIVARRVERKEGVAAVQLLVRDNGEGIPPEIQEQLFDPFFTTKDPGVGTGLGLTICHQIMEEHGGEIEIRSRLGEGTDVILEFSGNPPEGIGVTAPAAVNIDAGITS
jgi:signal transduction histidine kinase